MTTADLNRADPGDVFVLDDHLPECIHRNRPFGRCDWCSWAVDVPSLRQVRDLHVDAAALVDAEPSVAWVVAAGELRRQRDALAVDDVRVPSARSIVGQHLALLDDVLDALDSKVADAVASCGVIERRCMQTAGALAATQLRRPEWNEVFHALGATARSTVSELDELLSSETQAAGMLPLVDRIHWRPLPELRTQREWQRRHAPSGSTAHGARSHVDELRSTGLEAFVIESLVDRMGEQLLDLGEELTGHVPPVMHRRRSTELRATPRTRRLMWRRAALDWHLSFVDTGRASCWEQRSLPDVVVTMIPWQVALAIEVGEQLGLVSAVYIDSGAPSDSPLVRS